MGTVERIKRICERQDQRENEGRGGAKEGGGRGEKMTGTQWDRRDQKVGASVG